MFKFIPVKTYIEKLCCMNCDCEMTLKNELKISSCQIYIYVCPICKKQEKHSIKYPKLTLISDSGVHYNNYNDLG
jgi:hypothetical protein